MTRHFSARVAILMFLLPFVAHAQLTGFTGDTLGPEVSAYQGRELKWEQGSHDYFVMFRSMVANNDPSNDNSGQNPQADSCMTSNSFTVDGSHMPPDALVEDAFLIWISNNPTNNLGKPTDNQVKLDFTAADGSFTVSRTVTASRVGYLGEQGNIGQQDFEFEGMKFDRDGDYAFDTGYYTYRVGIKEFFDEIHQKGREQGYGLDGLSLLGTYTFSEMECYNDEIYWSGGAMIVGGWAIVVIYKSEEITPKMIYFYNGFKMYMDEVAPIPVTGFELPDTPEVRVSLLVNEGDPNLVDFTYYTNPESLMFKGQQAADVLYIFNECNPPISSGGQNYTEMYNSISSFYGWNDTTPVCIGGIPPNIDLNTIQYAMDFDTFIFSAENAPFDQHLQRGDTSFEFRVSANADVVITNMMVVSVTTRASKYDIPANPHTPNGREKHYCSCVSAVNDAVCSDRPFYFTIKIQNWGDELGEDVTVEDQLPPQVDYIPGTTEIARAFDENDKGTDWTAIPDGPGGTFPLAAPYKVADVLSYCDKISYECPDTVLIRFKVQPKQGLPKNTVIENIATINDTMNVPYRTNTTVPIRLRFADCPSAAECPEPPKASCGGEAQNASECQTNDQCGTGKKCDNGHCVADPDQFATGVEVEFALGKNSPANSSPIYIPSPSNGLVVGQFTIIGNLPGVFGKIFNLDSVKVKFDLAGQAVHLNNIKLVHDKNGNGVWDSGEPEIGSTSGLSSNYANFLIPVPSRAFAVNTLHYFIVVADAAYQGATIPLNATFKGSIPDNTHILASDAGGNATVKNNNVQFATFAFDPSQNYFIFTKGPHDPSVLPPAQMTGVIPLLQIRAAATDQGNAIQRISLRTISGSVAFGEGIDKITLFLDADNNGVGDIPLATPSFEKGTALIEINLPEPVSFTAGETKYLVLHGELSLDGNEQATLEIPQAGVTLASTSHIAELPVQSRTFTASCAVGDETCSGGGITPEGEEEESACGCAVVAHDSPMPVGALVALLLWGISIIVARRRIS